MTLACASDLKLSSTMYICFCVDVEHTQTCENQSLTLDGVPQEIYISGPLNGLELTKVAVQ